MFAKSCIYIFAIWNDTYSLAVDLSVVYLMKTIQSRVCVRLQRSGKTENTRIRFACVKYKKKSLGSPWIKFPDKLIKVSFHSLIFIITRGRSSRVLMKCYSQALGLRCGKICVWCFNLFWYLKISYFYRDKDRTLESKYIRFYVADNWLWC